MAALLLVCVPSVLLPGELRAGDRAESVEGIGGALIAIWDTRLGRALGRNISVAGGQIAVSTLDRRCALLDLEHGQECWNVRRAAGAQAGMTLLDSAVLGVSDHPAGWLFCLERESGKERWKMALGESWGAPLGTDTRVFAASLGGWVIACALEDGQLLWSVEVPGLVRSPLGLCDTLLIVPTVSDTLVALSAETGELRWGVAPGGALYGPPVVVEERLWSLSYEGRLMGCDPVSGERILEKQLTGFFRDGLAGSGGVLAALSTGGRLYVLESDSLRTVWQKDFGSAADLRPTIAGDLIWVGLRNGSVHALKLSDGRPVVGLNVAPPIAAPVVASGSRVVIGGGRGAIITYRWSGSRSECVPPEVDRDLASVAAAGATSAASPAGVRPAPFVAVAPIATVAVARAPVAGLAVAVAPVPAVPMATVPMARAPMAGELSGGVLFSRSTPGPFSIRPECGQGGAPSFCGGGVLGEADAGSDRTAVRWFCMAGWIVGTGVALWLQDEADDRYEIYAHTGGAERREAAFDEAEVLDRWALTTWISSELFFLVGLWAWLGGW
jgi:outer membrane protein assembly factor BamB